MGVADPTVPAAIVAPGARTPQFWYDAATAEVRRFCGWHVAPIITSTLVLDGSGDIELLLPSGRVRSISAVSNDGDDVLAKVEWSEKGLIRLSTNWTRKYRGVTVTLEHGYSAAEAADVAGVISSLADRSSTLPVGIKSQSVGPAAVAYQVAPLMQEEKDKLEPFRLSWAP